MNAHGARTLSTLVGMGPVMETMFTHLLLNEGKWILIRDLIEAVYGNNPNIGIDPQNSICVLVHKLRKKLDKANMRFAVEIHGRPGRIGGFKAVVQPEAVVSITAT